MKSTVKLSTSKKHTTITYLMAIMQIRIFGNTLKLYGKIIQEFLLLDQMISCLLIHRRKRIYWMNNFTQSSLMISLSNDNKVSSNVPLVTFSVTDIEHQLKLLNTQNASGPDCIPANVLHHCATEIAPILTAIFTQSNTYWRDSIRLAESKCCSCFQEGR